MGKRISSTESKAASSFLHDQEGKVGQATDDEVLC